MILAYDDEGPGPVVVLLHGFPLDRTVWASQVQTVGSTYRVIAPDLRGQGETAAPGGIYPIDDMADDVVETLDALRLTEPIVLGGLSMGGYVALSLAVRYAKRLRGLMLIGTRAEADTPDSARSREDLARRVEEAGDVGPVVDAMLPRFFNEAARERHASVVAALSERMRKASPRGVAGALRGMGTRPDRSADLSRITVPTLVMVGADDVITPPAVSRALAEALPHAVYAEIPEAGHLAPLENPSAANAAMLRFLQSLA